MNISFNLEELKKYYYFKMKLFNYFRFEEIYEKIIDNISNK